MKVTDLDYSMEERLIEKLDLMVERCAREKVEQDALLIVEGSEGQGKSNSSTAIAYYVQYKTLKDYGEKRPIHMFFRLESMLKFAKSTEKKIIIWDEPSLDALKKDSVSQMNKQLERLLMTCRKKRHFFIVNLTKFFKFSEYIVVDRCLGMIHMYSRNEIEPGRFTYIKKKNLENLYREYTSKHKRMYREFSSFRGQFSEVMKKHFEAMDITVETKAHATLKDYNVEKDKAIMSIGETPSTMSKKDLNEHKRLQKLRLGIALLVRKYKLNHAEAAQVVGIDAANFRHWSKIDLNSPISLGKASFEEEESPDIITSGVKDQENEFVEAEEDTFEDENAQEDPQKLPKRSDNI